MDAAQLFRVFTMVLAAAAGARFVFVSVSRAGDGVATLFVPPDRALGWPRGVQEGDEPWGWHGTPPTRVGPPGAFDSDGPPAAGDKSDRPWGQPRAGSFVVPVKRVAPIDLHILPH